MTYGQSTTGIPMISDVNLGEPSWAINIVTGPPSSGKTALLNRVLIGRPEEGLTPLYTVHVNCRGISASAKELERKLERAMLAALDRMASSAKWFSRLRRAPGREAKRRDDEVRVEVSGKVGAPFVGDVGIKFARTMKRAAADKKLSIVERLDNLIGEFEAMRNGKGLPLTVFIDEINRMRPQLDKHGKPINGKQQSKKDLFDDLQALFVKVTKQQKRAIVVETTSDQQYHEQFMPQSNGERGFMHPHCLGYMTESDVMKYLETALGVADIGARKKIYKVFGGQFGLLDDAAQYSKRNELELFITMMVNNQLIYLNDSVGQMSEKARLLFRNDLRRKLIKDGMVPFAGRNDPNYKEILEMIKGNVLTHRFGGASPLCQDIKICESTDMCVTPFIPLHIEVMKRQIKDEQSKQESERRAHEAAVRAEELQNVKVPPTRGHSQNHDISIDF